EIRDAELDHASGKLSDEDYAILDAELVDSCTAATDVCLHLAAAVGVQLILEQPLDSLLRNVRGSDVVISSVVKHGGKVLVASSSEIYGKSSGALLGEDSDRILGPTSTSRWAYSMAKAFSEVLANAYASECQAETITVRFFNTVGPRQTGAYGMVMPRFVQQALVGAPLTVYGDGSQTRCFTHVRDVTEAVLRLCDEAAATGKTFNIGSPHQISIADLARRVIERTGSDSEIVMVPYDEAYADGFEEIGCRHPDLSLIARIAGWSPRVTIDEMIDDVIAYNSATAAAAVPADLNEVA
ncbi:MAG: NAD-dependent epimerase/dehydratase family protein, partial [Actinobacteria bacterium]|nr:NAD-dependent epimerase/dehydratase family protein [Actinomycetota bacterium]